MNLIRYYLRKILNDIFYNRYFVSYEIFNISDKTIAHSGWKIYSVSKSNSVSFNSPDELLVKMVMDNLKEKMILNSSKALLIKSISKL